MLKYCVHRDCWITLLLVLFCGVMTWQLVRSEYFPESSSIHQLPPSYVAERFLKHQSASLMKILWKGEDIGVFSVRVNPTIKPTLKGSVNLEFPMLETKSKIHLEMECDFKNPRYEVDQLHLHGTFREVNFDLTADSKKKKMNLYVQGGEFHINKEFPWNHAVDITGNGDKEWIKQIPGLPNSFFLPSEEAISSMAQHWEMAATSTRVFRLGSWMEAYLVEWWMDKKMKKSGWAKLWMSPTGELLKLESDFGIGAVNEEFFEGISVKAN